MAKEEIIFEFQIDAGDALSELDKTKKAIIQLKEEQQALTKAYKEGNITVEEYAQESVRVEQNLKKQTSTYSDLTKQVQGTKSKTDELIKSNQALTSALDKVAPGLSGTITGLQGMAKAALAFIATPIGIVVTALGAAIGALTAYFKGSEEGQNRLNKIVQIGSTIFEKFMNVVEFLGEKVFDGLVASINAAGTAFKAVTDFLGINTDAVVGFFTEIDKEAQKFADTQARIDEAERDLILKRAETNLEVAKLREQAIRLEGDAKKAVIQEAIDLERGLVDQEVALAQLRADQAKAELERNGDDKEAKLAVAEATAAVTDAEAQRYEATLRFQKELEKIDEDSRKRVEEALELERELQEGLQEIKQEEIDQNEENLEIFREQMLADLEEKNNIEQSFRDIEAEQLEEEAQHKNDLDDLVSRKEQANLLRTAELKDKLIKQGMSAEQAELAIHKMVENQKLAATSETLGNISSLLKKNTVAYKVTGTAEALINTYSSAVSAYKGMVDTLPGPFGIAAGVVAAGASIALGLKNVAEINGVALAGGGKFTTKGPTLLLVGDNPGGRERVEVTPLSGKGTTRSFGRNGLAMAGGGSIDGSILAAASTQNIDTQFASQESIANMPPIYVSWTEKTDFENKMAFKAQLTEK